VEDAGGPWRDGPRDGGRPHGFDVVAAIAGAGNWDKKYGLWRVAEDDPDSDLYAESSDADAVISYIVAHA